MTPFQKGPKWLKHSYIRSCFAVVLGGQTPSQEVPGPSWTLGVGINLKPLGEEPERPLLPCQGWIPRSKDVSNLHLEQPFGNLEG